MFLILDWLISFQPLKTVPLSRLDGYNAVQHMRLAEYINRFTEMNTTCALCLFEEPLSLYIGYTKFILAKNVMQRATTILRNVLLFRAAAIFLAFEEGTFLPLD